jgi:hypothetical protein
VEVCPKHSIVAISRLISRLLRLTRFASERGRIGLPRAAHGPASISMQPSAP